MASYLAYVRMEKAGSPISCQFKAEGDVEAVKEMVRCVGKEHTGLIYEYELLEVVPSRGYRIVASKDADGDDEHGKHTLLIPTANVSRKEKTVPMYTYGRG